MKHKAILTALFLAGLAASFAVGSTAGILDGTTSTHATTTGKTGDDNEGNKNKSSCQHVELKGSNGSGNVSFTVTRANHGAQDLVGKSVTLTVPAGASVSANACRDATGKLTLRNLKVANHQGADEQ